MPTDSLNALVLEIRDRLKHLELMACYSAAIAKQTRKRLFIAKLVVAAAACAPFVAKLQALSSGAASWMLTVIPLVAIALPLWNPESIIDVASKLHGRYSEILPPVRDLWRLLRDTDQSKGDIPDLKKRIHAELAELDKRLATFAPEVGLLPDKPRLKQRCLASVPKYDVSGGGSAPAFGKGAVIYAPAAPPPGF